MAKKSRSTNALGGAALVPLSQAKMTRAQAEEQRRYRAEDALRTITRAAKLRVIQG